MVTTIFRSTFIIFLLAIVFQSGATETGSGIVARETEATSSACASHCLRSSSIQLYRTPPYLLTAKVSVSGSSLLGRMRGSVVSGEFTTPDNQKFEGTGWVGTRDAMIRMPVPAGGAPSGTYTFKVTNIKMRGNTTYRFDRKGSTVLTATMTIP